MLRRSRTLRAVATVLCGAQLACMTPMRPVSNPHDYLKGQPDKAVITRTDGTTVVMLTPRVVMDTLLAGWATDGATFIGMPLSEVQAVSAREPSTSRTLLLFGGVGVLVLTLIVTGGQHPDPQIIEEDLAPRVPPPLP